ncbi:MAG TPA: ABC transporter permease [Gemmatimonadaceae bacterium]|nr:ABC transporter permease [Gemmatimonadaceae bacterium]
MQAVLRDIRYGARSLRKSRALTFVALLALTLGIGLTTTMFSIVYGAMLKGLPFPNADELIFVQRDNLARGLQRMPTPIHDYLDYRSQQRSFSGIAAFYQGTVNVSGAEKAERYDGAWVSAEFFDVLQVMPQLGRAFRRDEETPGLGNVAVLSHSMWQDRFASDPRILGKAVRVDGRLYTVVGVMPANFTYPDRQAIWMPLQLDAAKLERGGGQGLRVIARLRRGVSLDVANTDVAGIARRIATDYKASNEGISASARPIMESEIGPQPRRLLWTMLGVVSFVLLIACANVANLLLDRAAHRTKEVGIRTALGASRLAVVRQFLSEALVLAVIGAVLGAGVAQVGIMLFNRAIVDTSPPFWLDIRLHPPVLLFVAAAALVASLFSGAIPAYQASRADINAILKDESRGASSFRIGRLSRALVVFEIALSCGLLIASGLMAKSIIKLRTLDPGITTENIFTARVGLPETDADSAADMRFFEALEPRLAALPAVRAVSLSSNVPTTCCGRSSVAIEGKQYEKVDDYPSAQTLTVSTGFFATFGVAALQGRVFSTDDKAESVPVVIVNQSFVRKHFASENPIGRRIRLGGAKSTQPWRTIVGVVPDIFTGDPNDPRDAGVLVPLPQDRMRFVSIAVRAPNAMSLTPQVRAAVASLDPDVPIFWVSSMTETVERSVWHIRVFGSLFMVFGVAALLLAAIGLYAVMAFSVSRRAREVGVRIALGARTSDVLRLVLRQGLIQLALGTTLGLGLGALVSQGVAGLLFEVQPRDPTTFAAVVALLTATGLLACYIPARRAARVDPLSAMRAE